MKRMRGRNHRPGGGGGGGGGGGPIRHHNGQIPLNRNHVFDSNGPDLRIRGTAQQLFEKYLQLGRDATSSGDRVMAEGYFQHAEHYFRILNAIAQANQQGQGQGQGHGMQQPGHGNNQQRGRMMDEPDADDRGGEDPLINGNPQAPERPAQAAYPSQNQASGHPGQQAPYTQPNPAAASGPPANAGHPGDRPPVERWATERPAAEPQSGERERGRPERPQGEPTAQEALPERASEPRPSEPRPPRERAPRRERRQLEPEAAPPADPRPEAGL